MKQEELLTSPPLTLRPWQPSDLEAVHKNSVIKNGVVMDEKRYVKMGVTSDQ